jgi:hypothetical protein
MAFTKEKLRSISNPSLNTLLLEEGDQWGHSWDIYRYLPREGKNINDTSSDKWISIQHSTAQHSARYGSVGLSDIGYT